MALEIAHQEADLRQKLQPGSQAATELESIINKRICHRSPRRPVPGRRPWRRHHDTAPGGDRRLCRNLAGEFGDHPDIAAARMAWCWRRSAPCTRRRRRLRPRLYGQWCGELIVGWRAEHQCLAAKTAPQGRRADPTQTLQPLDDLIANHLLGVSQARGLVKIVLYPRPRSHGAGKRCSWRNPRCPTAVRHRSKRTLQLAGTRNSCCRTRRGVLAAMAQNQIEAKLN